MTRRLACPSGASAWLSQAGKNRQVIGRAVLDRDTCLLAAGRECTACIRHCPYEALAIVATGDGFACSPAIDPARCNGCGACESVRPVRPRRAVRILPVSIAAVRR